MSEAPPRDAPAGVRFTVELDEERQIIRQWVDGHVDLETFRRVEAETEACAQRLEDPGRVRILVNAPKLGHSNRQARRAMADSLRRPTLHRLAIHGANPIGRVMIRFLTVAAGVDKARGFATESEAVAWLLS
jgi:hypothetical protein